MNAFDNRQHNDSYSTYKITNSFQCLNVSITGKTLTDLYDSQPDEIACDR